jgi:hypothetical protein
MKSDIHSMWVLCRNKGPAFRGVRITQARFQFGYLITEPSQILTTETSVIRCLFIDIRKPTKLNGLQVNHYVVQITQSTTNTTLVTITNLAVQCLHDITEQLSC